MQWLCRKILPLRQFVQIRIPRGEQNARKGGTMADTVAEKGVDPKAENQCSRHNTGYI